MKKVERYRCDHCGKLLAKEETMKKHEAECIHNPLSINCYRCEFACVDDYEQYNDYDDSIHTRHDVPQCAYLEDVIDDNIASRCSRFRRSDKPNYERTYDEAYKNYDRISKEELQ